MRESPTQFTKRQKKIKCPQTNQGHLSSISCHKWLCTFQTGSTSKQPRSAANRNLNTELSMDMDLSDICTKGQEMPAKIDKQLQARPGTVNHWITPQTTILEKYAECLNSPAILPPAHDTAILQGSPEGNPDQCAPFIPPSLCDEQMLSVNEKELEMFDMNTFGCEEFVDAEVWEISNYFDKANQLPQNGLVKRNLSTPTFPPMQELNPEQ